MKFMYVAIFQIGSWMFASRMTSKIAFSTKGSFAFITILLLYNKGDIFMLLVVQAWVSPENFVTIHSHLFPLKLFGSEYH